MQAIPIARSEININIRQIRQAKQTERIMKFDLITCECITNGSFN